MIIGADFIDNTMYFYDSTGISYKYDESAYTDWDGSANVAFSKTFKLNDLHLDNKWLKLSSVHVSCDGKTGGITFELFIDGVSVNQYTVTGEKYQNMRPLITSNPRGRRFTVQGSATAGEAHEVFDVDFTIEEAIQKNLIRRV